MPVGAHELPYQVVTYVTIDGLRVHVLVRVPQPLLSDARLPTRNGGYLDLSASDEPLRAVASDVARNFDLMDNGQPLPPPVAVSWAVTRSPDARFDSYETALARFMVAPLPVDTPVDPSFGSVDLHLEYVLEARVAPERGAPELKLGPTSEPDARRLSIRVNGFRPRTRPTEMLVHYAGGSTPRTFVTTGSPRRVEFEPSVPMVAPMFARLGMERLALGFEHLLFILCLAIPQRPLRTAFIALASFAAAYVVSLGAASLLSGPPLAANITSVQTLVAALLIIAALQNVTTPRFAWVAIAAAAFGLFDGLAFGFMYRQEMVLAGAHTFTAFVSFAAPILVGSVWLLLLIRPLVGLVYRSKIPSEWAVICLSAIPIHAGLHVVMALRG